CLKRSSQPLPRLDTAPRTLQSMPPSGQYLLPSQCAQRNASGQPQAEQILSTSLLRGKTPLELSHVPRVIFHSSSYYVLRYLSQTDSALPLFRTVVPRNHCRRARGAEPTRLPES